MRFKLVEKKIADASDKLKHTFGEQGVNSVKLRKLIFLIWVSFIISWVSDVIACFDVREYYNFGEMCSFLVCIFSGLWGGWLNFAIMERKNWARKSFIGISLWYLGFLSGDAGDSLGENIVCNLLTIISLLIDLYCVYLLSTNEVRLEFQSDSKTCGIKATVDRWHCTAFWISFGLFLIIGVWWDVKYDGTDAWWDDCRAAAVAGSSNARKELINKYFEEYIDEENDETEAEVKAIREVDYYIKRKKSE